MLRTLRIAMALLRIPHLATSLFAFPLIFSLVIVFIQLFVTGAVVQLANTTTASVAATAVAKSNFNHVRWIIFGSGAPRSHLKVCRWQSSGTGEAPPEGGECQPDRLDVAIHVQDPATYDVARFVRLFDGHVDRLHVCRSCEPDVVITPRNDGLTTSLARSVFGLAILFLPYSNTSVGEKRIALTSAYDEIQRSLGSLSMHIPEISDAVGITSLKGTLPITANISLLVIIALWLALRAHRKVLDYFSHNDVLLPLAAACGKHTFYSAIWMLTVLRVGCFLCASVPLMYLGLSDIIATHVKDFEFTFSFLQTSAWLLALISTLSFATVVASIAELKHRHHLLSAAYRFIPLVGAFLGALVWGLSFLIPFSSVGGFRMAVSALPVVGIAPILVAPVTGLSCLPMLIHTMVASVALMWILRRNARWFAAHLEEV
jgi:hypothetical protein